MARAVAPGKWPGFGDAEPGTSGGVPPARLEAPLFARLLGKGKGARKSKKAAPERDDDDAPPSLPPRSGPIPRSRRSRGA
jgi:hypothetical protein